jgi:hypothetical protein
MEFVNPYFLREAWLHKRGLATFKIPCADLRFNDHA